MFLLSNTKFNKFKSCTKIKNTNWIIITYNKILFTVLKFYHAKHFFFCKVYYVNNYIFRLFVFFTARFDPISFSAQYYTFRVSRCIIVHKR